MCSQASPARPSQASASSYRNREYDNQHEEGNDWVKPPRKLVSTAAAISSIARDEQQQQQQQQQQATRVKQGYEHGIDID